MSETFPCENPDLFSSVGLRLVMRALTLGMLSFLLFFHLISTELGQRCSSMREQGSCFHAYTNHSSLYFAFLREHYCCLISAGEGGL